MTRRQGHHRRVEMARRRYFRRVAWRVGLPVLCMTAVGLASWAADATTLTSGGSSYGINFFDVPDFGSTAQSISGLQGPISGSTNVTETIANISAANDPFVSIGPNAGSVQFIAAGTAWSANVSGTRANNAPLENYSVVLNTPGATFDSQGLLNTVTDVISTQAAGIGFGTGPGDVASLPTDFVLYGNSSITGTLTFKDNKTNQTGTVTVNDPNWNGQGLISNGDNPTGFLTTQALYMSVQNGLLAEFFCSPGSTISQCEGSGAGGPGLSNDGFTVINGTLALVNGSTNLTLTPCSAAGGYCDPSFEEGAPPPPPPPIALGVVGSLSPVWPLGLAMLVVGFLASRRRRRHEDSAFRQMMSELAISCPAEGD